MNSQPQHDIGLWIKPCWFSRQPCKIAPHRTKIQFNFMIWLLLKHYNKIYWHNILLAVQFNFMIWLLLKSYNEMCCIIPKIQFNFLIWLLLKMRQFITMKNTSRTLVLPGHMKVGLNQGVYIEQDQVEDTLLLLFLWVLAPSHFYMKFTFSELVSKFWVWLVEKEFQAVNFQCST